MTAPWDLEKLLSKVSSEKTKDIFCDITTYPRLNRYNLKDCPVISEFTDNLLSAQDFISFPSKNIRVDKLNDNEYSDLNLVVKLAEDYKSIISAKRFDVLFVRCCLPIFYLKNKMIETAPDDRILVIDIDSFRMRLQNEYRNGSISFADKTFGLIAIVLLTATCLNLHILRKIV